MIKSSESCSRRNALKILSRSKAYSLNFLPLQPKEITNKLINCHSQPMQDANEGCLPDALALSKKQGTQCQEIA